ncbi:MAG: 1-acyl-sn-glycerol-3-phosphate acyltransferase [Firmicutes bacterium]|nr:1-acyl-sn-glycerol-3-phosphate acyltransferase [Bacillota bacterium]
MKIIPNLPGLTVLLKALGRVKKYIKPIEQNRAAGNFEEERKLILEACQIFAADVSKGLDIKYNVIHPENLPKEGPVVFISNHQSYADILTFLYVIKNHQIGFIAKDELKKAPFIGNWILRIRGLFMERGDVRSSLVTINEGARYLKDGFSLVIFPEGTRSQRKEMAEFKPGSLKLATKARVPIIPITIDGSYHVFEERGAMTKGQTVDFMVHPAIDTASLDRKQLGDLPEQVEETIRQGLATLQRNQ